MYSVHFAHGSGYEMLVMRSSIFVRTLINGKRQAPMGTAVAVNTRINSDRCTRERHLESGTGFRQ